MPFLIKTILTWLLTLCNSRFKTAYENLLYKRLLAPIVRWIQLSAHAGWWIHRTIAWDDRRMNPTNFQAKPEEAYGKAGMAMTLGKGESHFTEPSIKTIFTLITRITEVAYHKVVVQFGIPI